MKELGYWSTVEEGADYGGYFPLKWRVEGGVSESCLAELSSGVRVAARAGEQVVTLINSNDTPPRFVKIAFNPQGDNVRVCRVLFRAAAPSMKPLLPGGWVGGWGYESCPPFSLFTVLLAGL